MHSYQTKTAQIVLYCCIIMISYLATTSRTVPIASDMNDKINHTFAFFVLTFLAYLGFPKIKNSLLIITPLVIYGVLIELTQQYLPHREFSLLDLVADISGCLIFFLVQRLIRFLPTR